MRIFGTCEKCKNELKEGVAILTQPSKLFKGTNKYLVCNECGAVSLYNESLGTIFNIDKHKDNESVLNELTELLEELNMEIVDSGDEHADDTVKEEDILYCKEELDNLIEDALEEACKCAGSCEGCSGSCGECSGSCGGCSGSCECHKEPEVFNHEDYVFVFDKVSEDVSLLAKKDISILGDINKYSFFALEPVLVKPVTTYEIIKK